MPAKTSPDPKNTSVNNAAEATTNTDRRAFMAGAAGAGASLAGLAATSPAHAADMAVPKDMKGKTAFVTGAARGIGRSCADALAARGANIVILDVAEQIADVPYLLATAGTGRLRYRAGADADALLDHRKDVDDDTFLAGIKAQFGL